MNALFAALLWSAIFSADAPSRFSTTNSPSNGEVIVWIGGENSVIEQEHSWIEATLLTAFQNSAAKLPIIRHMGWEGDTVYRQNRMENWGSWAENLNAVQATIIFLWFGAMESLDQAKTVAEFTAAYEKLIDELNPNSRRIVIVSPTPFERDLQSRNATLGEYVQTLRELARRRQLTFVDLFSPHLNQKNLTRNGVHLTSAGVKQIAPTFVKALSLTPPSTVSEPLRGAIAEKNRIWFDIWRPMNWAFAFGDRTTQPFAQPAPPDRPSFVGELKKGLPRVQHAEATVEAILAGKSLPPKLSDEPPRSDPPALSPEDQKKNFKIRDGFSVDLFASEAQGVIRPLQIRWDERGRLWVVCAPSYPHLQPAEKPSDFILVLEDTDNDGRADKSFRWAEGLKMPMGMEFGPDGIFVCESTRLVYLRDTDGDNRADTKEVLLSGFGTGDSHQNINSIRWGADGHLWFTQGFHIWSYIETTRGIVELNRSGIWRFNPRTLKLESFLNESAAGLNCWGVAFDAHGQVFHGSGADTAIWHTTPALIPTLHPLNLGPGLARSRGKSAEPEFLGSSHLPDDLRGVLLKSIYFTSQVGLYRLRDDGAGFASDDLGDLISSSSPEFRPLETRVGPDGAIYICDWFNAVIGHYQASYRDPRRDRSHGRIWRITANNRPLLKRPKLETLNVAELIRELASPERWNRDQAKFLLYRKPREAVLSTIKPILSSAPEPILYELSGVLAAHEAPDEFVVTRFLASTNFHWRAWGARLAGIWADRLPNPTSLIRKAVTDEHPRVRMEAIVAASALHNSAALSLATLVIDHPMDPSIEHALTLCIHQLKDHAATTDFGNRYHALARVLSTIGGTNAVTRMRELKSNVTGAAREKLLAALVEFGNVDDLNNALRESPESPMVLNASVTVTERGKIRPNSDLIQKLLTSPFAQSRIAGAKIAAASKNNSTLPEIRKLTSDADLKVKAAALRALAQLDLNEGARQAAKVLHAARTAEEAGAAINAVAHVKNGLAELTAQLGEIPNTSARAALEWMAINGIDDEKLLTALKNKTGAASYKIDFSEQLVKQLVAETIKSGNSEAGAKIFRRSELACLGCHRVANEGPEIPLGPDLSAIGRAMTPETIVESVLWPKRQIKEGFLLTQITMKDGTAWHGFKASETREELKIRQPDGTETTLSKNAIQSRTDTGTLMPDGLTDALSSQERLDLLRYLLELGK